MTPETQSTPCPQCGHPVRRGQACANCTSNKIMRLVHRELFLLLLLAAISLGAYFATRAFADANREMKVKVSLSWYQKGNRLLEAGRPNDAVAAFRKAVVNDRTNRLYTQALARALETAGRDKEALELLLQLREAAPEDPDINVELGRIAVRQGNIQDAIRYYHNALYGIWTGDDVDLRRIQVRRELINFLIAQHARDQALAEILAFKSHLSDTPASHLELGSLFLRAGDPQRALTELRSVLHEQPHNQEALQAAGQAAFEIGDYAQAHRFLAAVAAPDPDAKGQLQLATLVVDNDPLEPRLAAAERGRRLLNDFTAAAQRVRDCAAAPTAPAGAATLKSVQDRLDSLRPSLTAAHLKSDPDLAFSALDLVYEAEDAGSRFCGTPRGTDMALLLIGQKARRTEP